MGSQPSVTSVRPVQPGCADMPAGEVSPWHQLVEFYFEHSDLPQRLPGGAWGRAQHYWPAAYEGDPQADALAAAILSGEVTRQAFEDTLLDSRKATAHPALSAFVEHVQHLPPGLDFAAAMRGAHLYRLLPPLAMTIHGVVGGFLYAAMQPNAALALATSANIPAATHRRYMRTARYVLDITAPGGLVWGGIGCRSACRVRLVHGFVRAQIKRSGDWDTAYYGAPIHLISGLLAAAVTGIWGLTFAEREGCRFSAEEQRDMAMFNALQAHYQGVDARYIPLDYAEWQEFVYWALWHSGLPRAADMSRTTPVLTALLHNGYPFSDNALAHSLFNALTLEIARRMFGPELCTRFNIPPSRLGALTYRALQPNLRWHVAANNVLPTQSYWLQRRADRSRAQTERMVERTLRAQPA